MYMIIIEAAIQEVKAKRFVKAID